MPRISLALTLLTLTGLLASGRDLDQYSQTNLVSDLPGVANNQDPDLVNPWGIVAGPKTPFWVSDNGTGLSTLYNGTGTKLALVVTVPPPMGSPGPSAPTGIVFNSVATDFGGSHFIFDTEDGTVSAWSSGTAAALEGTSPSGSVYKGLAIGNNGSGSLLYATNFGLGRVDVFNASFNPVTVPGGFKDPTLPAGYAPFDVQNINGNLYVTYAEQDAAMHDDVAGPGHGYVDVYDTNGNLLHRLVSQGALNSPWGLALAPAKFGAFSGDLLVGNFGDGTINAYDPVTGAFKGTLDSPNGMPLVNQGLWGLTFGNAQPGQGLDTLFFTAGIPGPDNVEDHGLYGSIQATPEPGQALLVGISGLALFGLRVMRRRRMRKGAQSV